MNDYKVAIVGAGAAGLAAARELQRRGMDFVVLESSHRIGGRAYTEELAPGIHFDLGAHWIMAPSVNPLMPQADKRYLQRDPGGEHYTKALYFENGDWLPDDAYKAFGSYWNLQFDRLRQASGGSADDSVYDVIDNDNRWAPYFHMFFAQDYTHDVDQVCAADAIAYQREEDDIAVLNGLGNLLAEFGKPVPVSLNTAVRRVNWNGERIKIDTGKGQLTVDKIIVTVSNGALINRDIEFSPRLPDWKLEAITALPLGSCTRVAMLFDASALRDLPQKFTVDTSGDGPVDFRNRMPGYEFVEVTTGGRMAAWMEKSGESAAIDLVLRKLRDVAGEQAVPTPKRTLVSAWDGDAWTRGAYSAARPGQSHQRQALAQPIDARLFFAGEATSTKQYASVHGAMQSGRNAARLVAT